MSPAGCHSPSRGPKPRASGSRTIQRRTTGRAARRSRRRIGCSIWSCGSRTESQGYKGFATKNYFVVRSGETGSWLGRQFQGRGIGTLMRQAICALLFDHLEAAEIISAAFTDNPASLAVSRKVGYVDNGTFREQRRPGELALSRKLLLTADRFIRPEHLIEVEGIAPVRSAIGLSP